jgi:nucleoside phosphorylase/CheY-like chemotaxis protein
MSIMGGDQECCMYLRRLLAYAMMGNPKYDVMFILYGASTRNGKSTFANSVLNFFGDYATTTQPETLSKQKYRGSGNASPEIVKLKGRRYINIAEPPNNCEIELEITKAMHKLQLQQYDLLILDIKLPSFIGGEKNNAGGVMLLDIINDTDNIKKPLHIVGLTAYNEIHKEYEDSFVNNIWALLKYSAIHQEWKNQIRNKLKYLLECKKQMIENIRYPHDYIFDIAIVTAVDIEFNSVLNLDANWKDRTIQNDCTHYKEGILKTQNKDYKLILSKQLQMGMPAASALTMKLIYNFTPRYICFLGIAAGKQDRVKIGDIIVAAECWDYGSGKIRGIDDGKGYLFEQEPHQISINTTLKELFSLDYSKELHSIRNEWNKTNKKVTNDIEIHVGPMASGASVIQNDAVVKDYIDPQNRKLLGLDMETYGLYYAAENCPTPRPQFFSIKTVCDYADKGKNDNFQPFAAYVSAQFFMHFIKNSHF